jgi:Beta-lactamase enzyme family
MSVQTLAISLADLLLGAEFLRQWPTKPPIVEDVVPSYDHDMQAYVQSKTRTRRFSPLRVGVIDFVGRHIALKNADVPTQIDSSAKIAILYAAFQLREDVRSVVRHDLAAVDAGRAPNRRVKDVASLRTQLLQTWPDLNSNELKNVVRDRPNDMAHIEHIFDLSELQKNRPDPEAIDFLGFRARNVSGEKQFLCGLNEGELFLDIGTEPEKKNIIEKLEGIPHGSSALPKWQTIEKFPFAERLWMAMVWSDNVAASTCIWDIGLPYIQALLMESHLFDRVSGGLWLERSYHVAARPPTRFTRVNGYYNNIDSRLVTPQNGTVRKLAAFLIALVNNELISEEASHEMKRLLRPLNYLNHNVDGELVPYEQTDDRGRPTGERYGIPSRVERATPSKRNGEDVFIREVFAKAGLVQRLSECAYVEVRPGEDEATKLGFVVLNATGDLLNEFVSDFTQAYWKKFR